MGLLLPVQAVVYIPEHFVGTAGEEGRRIPVAVGVSVEDNPLVPEEGSHLVPVAGSHPVPVAGSQHMAEVPRVVYTQKPLGKVLVLVVGTLQPSHDLDKVVELLTEKQLIG